MSVTAFVSFWLVEFWRRRLGVSHTAILTVDWQTRQNKYLATSCEQYVHPPCPLGSSLAKTMKYTIIFLNNISIYKFSQNTTIYKICYNIQRVTSYGYVPTSEPTYWHSIHTHKTLQHAYIYIRFHYNSSQTNYKAGYVWIMFCCGEFGSLHPGYSLCTVLMLYGALQVWHVLRFYVHSLLNP
jgi:hypothetical protein